MICICRHVIVKCHQKYYRFIIGVLMKQSYDEEGYIKKEKYADDLQDEKTDKFRGISRILFVLYLLALVWIEGFKMSFPVPVLEGDRLFNLIPFQGTAELLGRVPLAEYILKGLLYVPFGIYMSMLKPHLSIFVRIIPVICVSVTFEIIEIIVNTGILDTTDMCMSIAGAAGGIIIEYVIFRTFPRHYEKILLISMAVFSVVIMMIVATGLR